MLAYSARSIPFRVGGRARTPLLSQPVHHGRVSNERKGQGIAVAEDHTEKIEHARRRAQIVEK